MVACLRLPLLAGVLAFFAGCGSSSQPRPAAPETIEDPAVLAAHRQRLTDIDKQFLQNAPGYAEERARLVQEEPRTAPWLAKAMIGYAVRDHDQLQREGVAVAQVAKNSAFASREFFRARRELVELDAAGRAAIVHYLLRSPRKELREIGGELMRAQPPAVAVEVLAGEADGGDAASARESLRVLADYPRDEKARQTLERAARSTDWQVRGTAVRSLAKQRATTKDPAAAEWLWQVARRDSDPWVRQQALAGFGDIGDPSLVPPLVDELEKLLAAGRGREAEGAVESLRALTGATYGAEVGKWRTWLVGRRR